MATKEAERVRCSGCGRFVAFGAPLRVDFTPDSHFTYERTDWYHPECYPKKPGAPDTNPED